MAFFASCLPPLLSYLNPIDAGSQVELISDIVFSIFLDYSKMMRNKTALTLVR